MWLQCCCFGAGRHYGRVESVLGCLLLKQKKGLANGIDLGQDVKKDRCVEPLVSRLLVIEPFKAFPTIQQCLPLFEPGWPSKEFQLGLFLPINLLGYFRNGIPYRPFQPTVQINSVRCGGGGGGAVVAIGRSCGGCHDLDHW